MRLRGPALPGNRWDLAPPPTDESLPPVSVIVTHYEQPAQLARTLRALRRQRYAGDLEVVVADDGSRTAPELLPGVVMVAQEHRGFGAARARNAGRRAAGGEVLVFLDADTTPEDDFVASVSALPRHLPEAVVTGRRRHADLSGTPIDEDVAVAGPRHELPGPVWLQSAYDRTGDLLRSDETSFRFVLGAVLCCGAELFDETGGFDASFSSYGGEDWEWAHRAWTHGALLAHEPRAVAWHDGPTFSERRVPHAEARLRAETLAVASRVPVPCVAPSGLITDGAVDPLVTLAPGIRDDALVVTVDSVLSELPRAFVRLGPEQITTCPPDPRLGEHDGELLDSPRARSAWRRLHVHRACRGDRGAWSVPAERLAGTGGAGRVELRTEDGDVAATWTTLRADRRARRWGRSLDPVVQVAGRLRPLPEDLSLQAHWGGWA